MTAALTFTDRELVLLIVSINRKLTQVTGSARSAERHRDEATDPLTADLHATRLRRNREERHELLDLRDRIVAEAETRPGIDLDHVMAGRNAERVTS